MRLEQKAFSAEVSVAGEVKTVTLKLVMKGRYSYGHLTNQIKLEKERCWEDGSYRTFHRVA